MFYSFGDNFARLSFLFSVGEIRVLGFLRVDVFNVIYFISFKFFVFWGWREFGVEIKEYFVLVFLCSRSGIFFIEKEGFWLVRI